MSRTALSPTDHADAGGPVPSSAADARAGAPAPVAPKPGRRPARGLCVAIAVCLAGTAWACRAGAPPGAQAPSAEQDDPEADRAMVEGRWEDAVRLHRRLLAHEPGRGLSLYHLAYSVGSLGNRREEIELYERAVAAGYRSPDLLYNLGLARLDAGDAAGAQRALTEALEARPDEAEFHYAAARAALARTDDREGERHLVRATEIEPSHRQAWAALAELYDRTGRPADAALARSRAR